MQLKQLALQHKKTLFTFLAVCFLLTGYYAYQKGQNQDALILYGNVDVRQVSLAFNASERIETMLVEE